MRIKFTTDFTFVNEPVCDVEKIGAADENLLVHPPDKPEQLLRIRKLTGIRIALTLMTAVMADGLQLLLNIPGWEGPNQIIDIIAMLLTSWLIGFHWLLLPTFVLELIPLADDLPTWTACVAAVIVLRKRQQKQLQSQMVVPESSRADIRN